MKKVLITLLAMYSLSAAAQVKIGDNPTNIGASSLVELESINKALVVTRVPNTAAITAPVNGMMIYDLSSECIKLYENGSWGTCITAAAAQATVANCATAGITGNFAGTTTFTVTLTNNSFANSILSFTPLDLTLTGVNGVSVQSVSPTSVTLNPGQSRVITYTLTGRPAEAGTLTSNWLNTGAGLSCIKQTAVVPPPNIFYDGFENAALWTLLNSGQTNRWYIGSAAGTVQEGVKALYISSNSGAQNNYTNTSASVVQAYKHFTIPAGTTNANVSFKWNVTGENCCDYVRFYIIPANVTPVSGTQYTSGLFIGSNFKDSAGWQTYSATVDISRYAGQAVRFVIEWRNDGSAGTAPVAVDDILIY